MGLDIFNEFRDYMHACYGKRTLPKDQRREVEQAFLSGAISVLAYIGGREGMIEEIQKRLHEIGSFPEDVN